jgi:CBS domain-containing protein
MSKALAMMEAANGMYALNEEVPQPRMRGGAGRVPVTTIMTKTVVRVRPDMPLDSLAELLVRTGLSRVPVVDAHGKVVGMVSKTDLVTEQQQRGDTQEEPLQLPLRKGGAYAEPGMHVQAAGTTVEDVMSRHVVALSEDATVADAVDLMVTHHLHGVPVVSCAQRLLGMVSSLDVLSWVSGRS